MSSSKLSKDTLNMQSVYFFRANTNKVDSSKIIEMYLRTFIIKVLVFIILPPFLKEKRMTLTLNVPINIITNIYSYINKNVTNCKNILFMLKSNCQLSTFMCDFSQTTRTFAPY